MCTPRDPAVGSSYLLFYYAVSDLFFHLFIFCMFVFFFRPDLPHIILPNTKYMSINGGMASMACEATGDQPIHISWIKGSVQLNYKSANLR